MATTKSEAGPAGGKGAPYLYPSVGLLLIRLMVGAVFIYHGWSKVNGGVPKFAEMLGKMNVPLPTASAWISALTEFVGGILIAMGLFSRIAALPMAFNMAVAVFMVHWKNGFSGQGGYEYPMALGVILLALALTGPGRIAVTRRL